jgi:ethanolamine ammonia-lyase small subunit
LTRRVDSERNCLSSIHGEGLSYDITAGMLVWLMREAVRRLTGVDLKEDAPMALESDAAAGAIRVG